MTAPQTAPALRPARQRAAGAADALLPCESRSLGFDLAEAGWKHVPLSKLKRDTVYTVVQDGRSPRRAARQRRPIGLALRGGA